MNLTHLRNVFFIDLALISIELFNYLQVAVLVKFCGIADLKSLMNWGEDQVSGLLVKSFKSFLFKMNKTLHLFLNRPNLDSAKRGFGQTRCGATAEVIHCNLTSVVAVGG